MSRNLCDTECYFCNGKVEVTGEVHDATEADVHRYFSEYKGCRFADAECVMCGAKYLAWMDTRAHGRRHGYDGYTFDGTPHDLSFRSTFNDEPGEDDMPVREVPTGKEIDALKAEVEELKHTLELINEYATDEGLDALNMAERITALERLGTKIVKTIGYAGEFQDAVNKWCKYLKEGE